MKFISKPEELRNTFNELCKDYKFFEWAVAWAGDTIYFNQAEILHMHMRKIKKLIVGLHFHQTSPLFIKEYMHKKSVRFIKQTNGTFHPKIYLFYDNDKHWAAIIGSSNFTKPGFNQNCEANVLITNEDINSDIAFSEIRNNINEIWMLAKYFTNKEFAAYKLCYNSCIEHRKVLSHLENENGLFMTTDFDLMNWDKFYRKVTSNVQYNERLRLLQQARILFGGDFGKLPESARKCLAGIPSESENGKDRIDWKLFGSMVGRGDFKRQIICNNKHIAKAINSVPLNGCITNKEVFDRYMKEFLKAFPGAKNPLAIATRLLAIKRPDVFICVDSKNKKGLCKHYNITQSRLNIGTYWDLLIKRIQDDIWFKENVESELKAYKVAMLDCLCYK